MQKFEVSERVACRVLGQHRSTQRKVPRGRGDEDALTADIIAVASQYGRYGYRRITALLREAGWAVNVKRVERIWRREGLKVPQKQPKKSRLWLNDGSCIRLRPERPNHVWSYDFVEGSVMRPVRDLSDIGRDAVMLLGLCEGLDVLNDAADALNDADPVTRQARNAMVPMIEVIIEKARRLADDIEAAETATRKR